MKLAEALVFRADTQKRLEQIKARLLRNAKVQDGDQPAEDPAQLLVEYEATAVEFTELVKRINLTNAAAVLGDRSLTEALAQRDILRVRQAMYRDLAESASVTQSVATRSEVKFRSTVSVADIQKRADALAKELRDLDARVQESNWKIELAG